jgi:hypothetical protein
MNIERVRIFCEKRTSFLPYKGGEDNRAQYQSKKEGTLHEESLLGKKPEIEKKEKNLIIEECN